VGFTRPANAVTYWNDETQGDARDYADLPRPPDGVASTTRTVAANAAHLARLLKDAGHPAA
jgi:hypothetical protein